MKIISKFFDYYDSMVYVYGVDDLIEYRRLDLGVREKELYGGGTRIANVEIDKHTYLSGHADNVVCGHYYGGCPQLVICGKVYSLINVGTNLEPHYEVFHPIRHNTALAEYNSRMSAWSKIRLLEAIVPKTSRPASAEAVRISKILEQPIFLVLRQNNKSITVSGTQPVLSRLAVQNWYSAEQLFQDTSMFISNEIRGNPDVMPPTKLTDKEKIVSHGMDPRFSFRHRK